MTPPARLLLDTVAPRPSQIEALHDLENGDDVAPGNLFALVGGQCLRGPHRILNLAPIDLGRGQLSKVVAGEVCFQGGCEIAPHLLARIDRQVPVVEGDVDT